MKQREKIALAVAIVIAIGVLLFIAQQLVEANRLARHIRNDAISS